MPLLPMPTTREEFDALLPDEDTAEAIFVKIRWPDGVSCPGCGSHDMRRLSTRKLWQCHACRAHTSVRSGTVMHRSKLPLREWMFVAWRCSTPAGASARSIATELGRRYETVWAMVHKLRASLAERGAWPLEGLFGVGSGQVPAPKKSNCEGPRQVNVRVATVVGPTVFDPLRFEVATGAVATDDLEELARERHTHFLAKPVAWGRHVAADTLRRLRLWLTARFTGVSRRFMANYLAQFAYTLGRAHRSTEMFGWILRRMASEPWRPRSDLALAAP